MRRRLFDCCRSINLGINILLDAKQESRSLILSELQSYLSETKRFTTRELSRLPRTTNFTRVNTVQFTRDKKIQEKKIRPSGL